MLFGAQTVHSIVGWARKRFESSVYLRPLRLSCTDPTFCLPILMRLPSQQCAKKVSSYVNSYGSGSDPASAYMNMP